MFPVSEVWEKTDLLATMTQQELNGYDVIRTFDTNVRFCKFKHWAVIFRFHYLAREYGVCLWYGGQGIWIIRRWDRLERNANVILIQCLAKGKHERKKGWPLNGQGIERWYRIPVPNHAGIKKLTLRYSKIVQYPKCLARGYSMIRHESNWVCLARWFWIP